MTWVVVILVIALVAVIVYGSSQITSGMFVRTVCRVPSGAVLLTFDDGPDPTNTPQVLDTLRRHGICAIFFLVGEKAQAHPELVRRIVAEGHTVGNHTMRHNPFHAFLLPHQLKNELQHCHDVLASLGAEPRLYRPPLGITNQTIAYAVRKMHYRVVGWSIRSLDTTSKPRTAILERVVARLSPGSIILLHDRLDGAAQLTENIIEEIHRRGLTIANPQEITFDL